MSPAASLEGMEVGQALMSVTGPKGRTCRIIELRSIDRQEWLSYLWAMGVCVFTLKRVGDALNHTSVSRKALRHGEPAGGCVWFCGLAFSR